MIIFLLSILNLRKIKISQLVDAKRRILNMTPCISQRLISHDPLLCHIFLILYLHLMLYNWNCHLFLLNLSCGILTPSFVDWDNIYKCIYIITEFQQCTIPQKPYPCCTDKDTGVNWPAPSLLFVNLAIFPSFASSTNLSLSSPRSSHKIALHWKQATKSCPKTNTYSVSKVILISQASHQHLSTGTAWKFLAETLLLKE